MKNTVAMIDKRRDAEMIDYNTSLANNNHIILCCSQVALHT